jgi:predicted metal-dependent hydrolase
MKLIYDIVYSDRKKVSISVERDRRVIVRAPKSFSKEQLKEIVEEKKLWLYDKINYTPKYSIVSAKEFVSGESILFFGKNYKLEILKENISSLRFDNKKFYLSNDNSNKANRIFKNWYKQKAKELIIPKIKYYSATLGVDYNNIMIREMKYRWASCTNKNNLVFNWRIIKAPMFVIEYLIVHELAHLLESNHTDRFWTLVKIQIPNYLKAKDWLKLNGNILESSF